MTVPAQAVVLFIVDQLSAVWVERAIKGAVDLPNLRRLKDRGTTFNAAFSNNPVCCPARASIATGLTSHGHGVLECGYRLDPTIPTFMAALQAAGWRTAAVGKVHLLPQVESLAHDYRAYGFDSTFISEDPRAGEWLDWVRENHPDHYEAALITVWMTMVPDLNNYGADGRDLAQEIERMRAGHDWGHGATGAADADAYLLPFPAEVSQTEWITSRAVEWMRQVEATDDFFIQVSYVQPHGPFSPPAGYLSRVNQDELPEPIPAEWPSDPLAPAAFASDPQTSREDSIERTRWVRSLYFADLAHLDEQLGRVLGALESTGRTATTTVMFLSDHGELLGDHGFFGKWGRHYDACIRVPLVLAGPGFPAGIERGELVDLTDIAPTILELAGLPAPVTPLYGQLAEGMTVPALAGRSLLPPRLGATSQPSRRSVYVESNNPFWAVGPHSWARTVRTASHRYTLYPQGSGEQLFDLVADPAESDNLAGRAEFAGLREEMRDLLLEAVIAQDHPPTPRGLDRIGAW